MERALVVQIKDKTLAAQIRVRMVRESKVRMVRESKVAVQNLRKTSLVLKKLKNDCQFVDLAREDLELAREDLMIAKEGLRDIISVRREIVCNAMCEVDNLELEKEDKEDCELTCT